MPALILEEEMCKQQKSEPPRSSCARGAVLLHSRKRWANVPLMFPHALYLAGVWVMDKFCDGMTAISLVRVAVSLKLQSQSSLHASQV
eukprot:6478443-Amphidinium_carterae.1